MQQASPKPSGPKPHVVLRAICIGGERVEVDTVIELEAALASELVSANKVAPYVPPEKPAKAAKPKPEQTEGKPADD